MAATTTISPLVFCFGAGDGLGDGGLILGGEGLHDHGSTIHPRPRRRRSCRRRLRSRRRCCRLPLLQPLPPPLPAPGTRMEPAGAARPRARRNGRCARCCRAIHSQIASQRMKKSQAIIGSSASLRALARASTSAASPVSTSAMSRTPFLMPPAKSPSRKRGRIAFSMMILDSASVSVPSSPRPTSMRTLRSLGATMRMTPLSHFRGADAPAAAELIAEILDGVALQRRQRDDHELVGALVLERLEVGGDRHLLGIAQEARVIDHAAGQLRKDRLGSSRREAKAPAPWPTPSRRSAT